MHCLTRVDRNLTRPQSSLYKFGTAQGEQGLMGRALFEVEWTNNRSTNHYYKQES